jgi:conjugal transfer mating pair stabilization protein TraN
MAALTGTGSTLDTDGTRLDAAQRTTERSDGIDAAAVRQQAETEWWTNTLPALPGTP